MAQFPGGVRRKVLLQLLLLLCHPFPVVSVTSNLPLGFPRDKRLRVLLAGASVVGARESGHRASPGPGGTLPPETARGVWVGCPLLGGPSGLGSGSCCVTFTVFLWGGFCP